MLHQSSKDKIAFTQELVKRLRKTHAKYVQQGTLWIVPESIRKAIERMRPMARRYDQGDYRHTDDEASAEYDLSLWCVNQWRQLHGHPQLAKQTWQPFVRRQPKRFDPSLN